MGASLPIEARHCNITVPSHCCDGRHQRVTVTVTVYWETHAFLLRRCSIVSFDSGNLSRVTETLRDATSPSLDTGSRNEKRRNRLCDFGHLSRVTETLRDATSPSLDTGSRNGKRRNRLCEFGYLSRVTETLRDATSPSLDTGSRNWKRRDRLCDFGHLSRVTETLRDATSPSLDTGSRNWKRMNLLCDFRPPVSSDGDLSRRDVSVTRHR